MKHTLRDGQNGAMHTTNDTWLTFSSDNSFKFCFFFFAHSSSMSFYIWYRHEKSSIVQRAIVRQYNISFINRSQTKYAGLSYYSHKDNKWNTGFILINTIHHLYHYWFHYSHHTRARCNMPKLTVLDSSSIPSSFSHLFLFSLFIILPSRIATATATATATPTETTTSTRTPTYPKQKKYLFIIRSLIH